MLLQIKATETERLRSELEQILSSVTENVDILSRSVINQQNEGKINSTGLIVAENAENLFHIFQKLPGIGFQSPIVSVRLNDALKKYSSYILSKTLNSVIDSKVAANNAELPPNTSIHNSEDTEGGLIDKSRIEHIRSYSISIKLINQCQELKRQREELLAKVNSSSIQSQAEIVGLVAKRSYLEYQLKSLHSREEHLNNLKQHIRESTKFSSEFDKLYTDKKNKLKSLNSRLESLRKSLTMSKLKTLESYSSALNSSNRLSNLIKDVYSYNNGKAVNLASSAAITISECYQASFLSARLAPPLYQEICKRLNSTPFVTPIGKVVDRIHSIVADYKSVDLINEELSRSLCGLKSLRDSLHKSLEISRNAEKDVCLAMAGLLKKISVNCAKLSDSQRNLINIWNYWYEFIPQEEQEEDQAYSLDDLMH